MKPVVVEYPDELPGLLKMTGEQLAAEVRFLAAASVYHPCSARPFRSFPNQLLIHGVGCYIRELCPQIWTV